MVPARAGRSAGGAMTHPASVDPALTACGQPRAVRVGTDAWLFRVPGPVEAASLAAWLRSRQVDCVDVVPAMASVLVDGVVDEARLAAAVGDWEPAAASPGGGLVEVPVTYDGPDLETVARRWEVTPDEVVARHTAVEFVATFTGFAPGFSYLSGLPAAWALPRLTSPRSRVPAGSVALADQWCGIYPSESPGGWLLLGHTTIRLWDLSRARGPALLAPGTRVRFVVA